MERITIVLQRLATRGPSHEEGFLQLFVSKRLIQGLATAMMTLFTPIYLYTVTGEQFWIVGAFFALASFCYVVLLPGAMSVTNTIGFSRALAIGAVFSVAQYAILYFMDAESVWLWLAPLLLAIVGFRLFHWVPYHVDFTEFTKGGERGRDVSLMFATIAFMGVVGPVLAGFIITHAGYDALFLVAVGLLMAAGVSYLFVPHVEETFSFTYRQTFEHLRAPEFRPVLWGEMANGAETVVTLVAWPVFLYVVLDGSVLEVGAISTFVVGATIVIQLLIGKYLDKGKANQIKTLRAGSFFYAIGWIFKIFVVSVTQIFFIGLYHNIARIFIKTPYSAILYDMSGEQGHYVDEFTVMREMSVHTGRFLALCVMVLLTLSFGVEWTFIIAAAASLLVNLVYRAIHD